MNIKSLFRKGKELARDLEPVPYYWDEACTRIRGRTTRIELINALNGDCDYFTDYDTGVLLQVIPNAPESEWDTFADVESL